MLDFMYFIKAEQTDFSVVIKSRGKLPTRWKREIYRAGRSSAVAQFFEFFATASAAKKAGARALVEMLEKLCVL
jgi:hypothetical protein